MAELRKISDKNKKGLESILSAKFVSTTRGNYLTPVRRESNFLTSASISWLNTTSMEMVVFLLQLVSDLFIPWQNGQNKWLLPFWITTLVRLGTFFLVTNTLWLLRPRFAFWIELKGILSDHKPHRKKGQTKGKVFLTFQIKGLFRHLVI